MKSVTSIKKDQIKEKWFLVDAEGSRIGIIATKVAELLQDKTDPLAKAYHKPSTHVVVINAGKINFTQKRGLTKFYKSYSGYPGGLRYEDLNELFRKDPAKPLEKAIKGMLPKNKKADVMFSNLKVYVDANNPHEAQQPVKLDLNTLKI